MGVTASTSRQASASASAAAAAAAGSVRVVQAGGHVEQYHRKVTVEEVMRSHPQHLVTRPDVFQSPSTAVLPPETVLCPGDNPKLLLVPYRTVLKLCRKHGLPPPTTAAVPGPAAAPGQVGGTAPPPPPAVSGSHQSQGRSAGGHGAQAVAGSSWSKQQSTPCGPGRRRGPSRGTGRSPVARNGTMRGGGRTPTRDRRSSRSAVAGSRASPGSAGPHKYKQQCSSSRSPRDRKARHMYKSSSSSKVPARPSRTHVQGKSNISAAGGQPAPSQQGLDVRSLVVYKPNQSSSKIFPLQDGSGKASGPAHVVDVVHKEGGILNLWKTSKAVAAAAAAVTAPQSTGRNVPVTDPKTPAPPSGHVLANRLLPWHVAHGHMHEQEEDGARGAAELGALVKRINNLAVLKAGVMFNSSSSDDASKSEQQQLDNVEVPPSPGTTSTVTVKQRVQMFEEAAARAAAGQHRPTTTSTTAAGPTITADEAQAGEAGRTSESAESRFVVSANHTAAVHSRYTVTTPKHHSDAASSSSYYSAPDLAHHKSGTRKRVTVVPVQNSVPSICAMELTVASFHRQAGGFSSPGLVFAFTPSAHLAFLQKELAEDRPVPVVSGMPVAHVSSMSLRKDSATVSGNGTCHADSDLSGTVPPAKPRPSRTLKELIAQADMMDMEQRVGSEARAAGSGFTPPGRADEGVARSSDDSHHIVMQEDDACATPPQQILQTASACSEGGPGGDYVGSPDSDDSFIELVFDSSEEHVADPGGGPGTSHDRADELIHEVANAGQNSEMAPPRSPLDCKRPATMTVTELDEPHGPASKLTAQPGGDGPPTADSHRAGCKRPRLRLIDHLQLRSPPVDIDARSARRIAADREHHAMASTSSNVGQSSSSTNMASGCDGGTGRVSEEESETSSQCTHPLSTAAGDAGPRRPKPKPRPKRPLVGGRRYNRFRWRPRLATVHEDAVSDEIIYAWQLKVQHRPWDGRLSHRLA